MRRNQPFGTILKIALPALSMLSAAMAHAQTITNTANASWSEGGTSIQSSSNTVSFTLAQKSVSLKTFVVSAGGNNSVTFTPSQCGGAVLPLPGGGGGSSTAAVTPSNQIHPGELLYFSLDAALANTDPTRIDSVDATITTSSGDREVIKVYETGANTGVFAGAIPTSAVPPAPVKADCRLSIAGSDIITISMTATGGTVPVATAQLAVLADPYGLVFDSEDGTPVSGSSVTLIDTATGAPATVYAPDGVTRWPSIVISGQPVQDSAGNSYPMQPGEYRFPLVPVGTYRLAITPPAPYHAPSTATPAQVAGINRPDGSNVTILASSYGANFAITSPSPVRIDIPVDRPPVAVSLTKSVSQANATPGDLVFYTITARNPDPSHVKRGVTVSDTPSPLLRLSKNSVRLDGSPNPANITISANGRALSANFGDLAPGATRTMTYAMTVRLTAPPGQALNKAMATDARGTTAYASATVTIEPDTLDSRMTVIGRITDGDCTRTGPHIGIPGVRVMLEDGSFAVTDREGRYHFNAVVPGDHVVQVAGETLPDGGRFVNCGRSTRNARSAISRFVSGQGGSLAVADFYAVLRGPQNLPAPEPVAEPAPAAKPQPGAAAPAPAKRGLNDALSATLTADQRAAAESERIAAGAQTDWLALGDGPNDFLFPAPDHNPRAPAVRVVIRHRPGQKVELTANGKPVDPLTYDGLKLAPSHAYAISIWRGVPLDGDTTHLVALVKNPDGSLANTLVREIHFNQTPARVELVKEKTHLIADGRTRPVLALRILDRNGRPIHSGIAGDFILSAPYESAEAIDAMQSRALSGFGKAAPHWTVKGDDGLALVELAPTMVSGPLSLDFAFVDREQRRQQTIDAWVVPGDLKWTLVGLAEGALGSKSVADIMERSGRFDSDLGTHARTAFYAKGRVLGRYLLTVAYDSAKQRDDTRLLGAIDPKAYYTVFADGSDRRFDAATRNKLYIRIESRAINALFGDFETGLTQSQLLRYQRTLTGVKALAEVGGLRAQGFAASVASTHRHLEFQGGGISGPYLLGSKALIANSEQVVLQVRDRFRSELIVSTQTLSRFIDYDIDLLAGTITFKSPVLSRDSAQNPQFVVVDYEIDPANAAGGTLNAGGRVDYTNKGGTLRLGASMVSDKGDTARTAMGGVDLRWRPNAQTEIRAEAAGSRANAQTSQAWLIEAEIHRAKLDLLAYARSADATFGVGQMNGAELGRRKLGVDARLRLSDKASITGSAWHDDSLTDARHRDAAQLRGDYRTGQSDTHLSLNTLRDTLPDGTPANSTVAEAGINRKLLGGKLEVEASGSAALGKSQSVDLPARQALTLRYTLTPTTKLVGSYEIASGAALNARTARFGVEAQPWAGARVTTQLGEQQIAEYGARSFANFGLAQTVGLTRHLMVDATLDAAKVLGGFDLAKVNNPAQPVTSGGLVGGGNTTLTENFTAVTLGATWRKDRWATTLRAEWRNGELAERRGLTLGAVRQLGEGEMVGAGLTATSARGADGSQSAVVNGTIAAAWRPALSSFAWLGKLEYRSDRLVNATSGVAGAGVAAGTTALTVNGTANSTRVIGSVSANWSPRGRLSDEDGHDEFTQRSEIGLFGAVRYNLANYQDYHLSGTSVLGGADLHIGIGERIEIGGTATVRANLSDHTTSFAFGPAIGVVPTRDVLLTVGYNVAGFRDRDFSAARTTDKGVFVALKAKFDSGSFGFLGLGKR